MCLDKGKDCELNRREFLQGALATGAGMTAWGCAAKRGLEDPQVGKRWAGWRPGHFQAHFIYTGVAESIFLIFPDSTTMLIDCGCHAAHKRGKLAVPVLPDLSRIASEWIARYVLRVNPHGKDVDYMLLTHYHADHCGGSAWHAGKSANGKYWLSGFGQAMEFLTFRRAIDRAWPTFDDPLPMSDRFDGGTIPHMREIYRELERRGTVVERFRLEKGSDQIRPLRGEAKDFRVVPLCANGRVLCPDGRVVDVMKPLIEARKAKSVNENTLSIGLRFEYGPFRFYTAGDFSHHQKRKDGTLFEAEAEMAKVCGRCQVAKVNHHGHHSMPPALVKALKSRVYLACIWDQLHMTRDTMRNLADGGSYPGERLFAPGIFPQERRLEDRDEAWRGSVEPACYDGAHVVLDVPPGGQTYSIAAIDARDEEMIVRSVNSFDSLEA